MIRFERFTDRAQAAVSGASEIARRRNDGPACPEHVFLALAYNGVASEVLKQFGLLIWQLQREFENVMSRPEEDVRKHRRSPRMTEVLYQAEAFAERLGHNYVGDEHLLLALAAMAGQVAEFLGAKGIDHEELEVQLLEFLGLPEELDEPRFSFLSRIRLTVRRWRLRRLLLP